MRYCRRLSVRTAGRAVFLSQYPDVTPPALLQNVRHNKSLHEQVYLLTVRTEHVPFVPSGGPLDITVIQENLFQVVARCGFMETPGYPARPHPARGARSCPPRRGDDVLSEQDHFLGDTETRDGDLERKTVRGSVTEYPASQFLFPSAGGTGRRDRSGAGDLTARHRVLWENRSSRATALQALMHLYIFKKRAEFRIRLRTERIGDGSASAVRGLDGIQHSHVIRITGSFKPVMLNDRELIGREFSPLSTARNLLLSSSKFAVKPLCLSPSIASAQRFISCVFHARPISRPAS